MTFGIALNPRDIIQALIQFPNQPQKLRPALVISNNFVNQNSDRVIVLPITANPKSDPFMIPIQQQDIESGSLPASSQVVTDNIFTIAQTNYVKTFGRVTPSFYSKVMNQVTQNVLEINNP